MTRIDVDFNSRGRNGMIKISRRRADSDFSVGDIVELYDPAEPEMVFSGRVEYLDGSGRGVATPEWRDTLPVTWSTVDVWSEVVQSAAFRQTTAGGVAQRPFTHIPSPSYWPDSSAPREPVAP